MQVMIMDSNGEWVAATVNGEMLPGEYQQPEEDPLDFSDILKNL